MRVNRWFMAVIALIVAIVLVWFVNIRVNAEYSHDTFDEPTIIRCTSYCDTGITASGVYTRPGIIAGKEEWLGYVAALYEVGEDGNIGDFIGYYEFLDTGAGMDMDGDGYGDSIINGSSVDVYQPTLSECYEWVDEHGDYVYMQLIKGEG